ncbi:MAG: hypothetical protein G01um101470_179 [Parcubacteria group bacterium Gr01-1014_70]|nr:MAG: hypothetical protein G01um101470_179 [Parcubacteria group bacterium Gr01-1014_70]
MLHHTISEDLKEAMKSHDELRVSTLRMLIAAIRNKEISLIKKDSGLSETELLHVIRSEVKKRKEAAEGFEKGGRREMADKENKEAVILEAYLPAELGEKELLGMVREKIAELGVEHSDRNFGVIMKAVLSAVDGRAAGERVALAVKQVLRGT